MPVEIKELVIRAVATRQDGSAPAVSDGGDRDALVQACVKQVMRILDKRGER